MMRPNQVGFELTKACNYQCRHCFSRSGHPLSNEFTLEEIQRLLDDMYDLGFLFVNFTGGEPTLRPDITDILEYTCKFGEAQIYHFQTNGTTWTDEFLDTFLKIYAKQPGLDVQVSLDGYDRATYTAVRGGPPENFDRIVSLIKTLKSHGLEIATLMTITKATLPHALKTARFAVQELGVDQFLMIPLFPAGRSLSHFSELEFSREAWADFLVQVTEIKKEEAWGPETQRMTAAFFTLYDFVIPLEKAGLAKEIKSVWNFEEDDFEKSYMRPTICEAGFTDCGINAEGIVFPCTALIDSDFVAGNVRTEPLSQIWENSPSLNWFRKEAVKVCEKEPCNSCSHKKVCGGGCRLSAAELTGDRNGLDPRCPIVASYQRGSHD